MAVPTGLFQDGIRGAGMAYLRRFVGQALREGATRESILEWGAQQQLRDPQLLLGQVEALGTLPKLGAGELTKLGGLNTFRASFGLAPAETEPTEDRIRRANDHYAVLGVGNKMAVAEFDAGQLVELWPFEEFKKKLVKELPVGQQPFADYWLKHPDGRQYTRLVYFMPGSRDALRAGDYNGWHGFTVAPAPGDWSKNRDHLLQVICAGDSTLFEWTLNWLAALFQLPGRHAWSSIVLRGGQGIGKGHCADEMIGKCFHAQQYLHLIGANQLTADFNEHFSGKVFVFGDETCWGGEKQAANKIKGLVTEDTVIIHRKFLKAIEEPSALHMILASNADWPIAIDKDDRRFCVLDVSDHQRQDQVYFKALRDELEQGGRAAMLHDLLQYPINDALLRQPPDTAAKRDVKERTFSAEETFVQNWLMNVDGRWSNKISKSLLYEQYLHSLPRNVTLPRSIMGFGKGFKKVGIEWRDCKVEDNKNGYWFPPLSACRAAFDKALGTRTEWPTDDVPGSEQPGREPGRLNLEEVAQ